MSRCPTVRANIERNSPLRLIRDWHSVPLSKECVLVSPYPTASCRPPSLPEELEETPWVETKPPTRRDPRRTYYTLRKDATRIALA